MPSICSNSGSSWISSRWLQRETSIAGRTIFVGWHEIGAYKTGVINIMEGWEIIQQCELAPYAGLYNIDKLQRALAEMTTEQFNQFCREIMALRHFYASNQNAWATDEKSIVKQFHEGFLGPLGPII